MKEGLSEIKLERQKMKKEKVNKKYNDLSDFDIQLKNSIVKKEVNHIHAYTINVKNQDFKSEIITNSHDKRNIKKLINSILKLGDKLALNEIILKENIRDWISAIIFHKIENFDDYMKYLLRDFTEPMMTRMREQEKYVIGIILEQGIILCHSKYGERTITPNWKVMKRMLDKHNIMRYVFFQRNDNISLTFYENDPSIFLSQWLGLKGKKAYDYLGGKNRFFTEIHDIPLILELSDDIIEKKIINSKDIKIEGHTLILPSKVNRFNLTKIMRNRKLFSNPSDFLQDFFASHYELEFYQRKYNEILKSIEPYLKKIFDDEIGLRDIDGKIHVKKLNENFTILFCDENRIEIRESYLEKIKNKLINNEKVKLFHAGCEITKDPIQIKNFHIFNKLNCSLSKTIIKYYNGSFDNQINEILRVCLFHMLFVENEGKAISYFFKIFSEKLLQEIDSSIGPTFYEDDLIELKSKDFISGNNEKIITNLINDIDKKMIKLNFCLYILGYDEKSKIFEPILQNRYDDTRLNSITKRLKNNLPNMYLKILRMPLNSKTCFLILIVRNLKL